jgi:hypothetical protein
LPYLEAGLIYSSMDIQHRVEGEGVSTEQILGSEMMRATEAQRVPMNKPGQKQESLSLEQKLEWGVCLLLLPLNQIY